MTPKGLLILYKCFAAFVHANNNVELAPLFTPKNGIENRYIVVFKEGVNKNGLRNAIRSLNLTSHAVKAEVYREYSSISGFAVKMSDASLQALLRHKDVKYIEQDSIMHAYADTCLDQINAGWCLGRVGNVNNGKNYPYPKSAGDAVTVYVIDTGVTPEHSDFNGRAKQCANFVNAENGNDLNGHGTGVSSLVAGIQAGGAKSASICAIKVLNSQGSGSTSDIIAGINWVTKQSKKGIINLSLGGGFSRATNDAVDKAFTSGHFVVVAAGNDARDACNISPASAKNAFTIAASDENNNLASFSNFGSCVSLIAPGFQASKDGTFKYASGTSFSSPLVAGIAAVLKAQDNKLTPTDLKNAILANSAKNAIKNVKGSANSFLQAKCASRFISFL